MKNPTNLSPKHFLQGAIGVLALMLSLIALAIWQSAQPQTPSFSANKDMTLSSSTETGASEQDSRLDSELNSELNSTAGSKPSELSTATLDHSDSPSSQFQSKSKPQLLPQEPPSDYPAPAKKLHKLITDTDLSPQSTTLDQRIKRLNQQVDGLNQQLTDRGIALPSDHGPSSALAPASDSSLDSASNSTSKLAERMQAIKLHMANKD